MPSPAEFAIVIPARFASSRFPGKPLADIHGKPMIHHVWERCCAAATRDRVFVATDDARIRATCASFGARVIMTPPDCATGTDRVARAAARIESGFIVNVQGDEPLIDPQDIVRVADTFRRLGARAVVNAMTAITDEREFRSRDVPKVAAARDGRLLYMSRAAIPCSKSGAFAGAHKQVCIYAFSRQQLAAFVAAGERPPLERVEDIEILRFLDLGIEVHMLALATASIAVDTPADLERVRAALG
ncbi:MAG: 8-amino-3,8-dideoxy-manno-octulosonate cytidylyltransferase [Pseudomonadales bacterium]|nr:8-amino-3,8-dideoxy-manno-octulosonate cytidylyltransferase [Pseudomonadales bacterium]